MMNHWTLDIGQWTLDLHSKNLKIIHLLDLV